VDAEKVPFTEEDRLSQVKESSEQPPMQPEVKTKKPFHYVPPLNNI
jgi:hypothetical protein